MVNKCFVYIKTNPQEKKAVQILNAAKEFQEHLCLRLIIEYINYTEV